MPLNENLDLNSFPRVAKTLAKVLSFMEGNAYFVGGFVRDVMLGREAKDVDVAVNAPAKDVSAKLASELGGHAIPLDEERQIYRVAAISQDGSSTIDVGSIHGDILDDLNRRDFTINAMAISFASIAVGHSADALIDPHEGIHDLRAGIIRQIHPSVFKDDAARLMRAPRLAAKLSFAIDSQTQKQIREDARLVANVAAERVRDELLSLFEQPRVTASIRNLDSLGLLGHVIPEIDEARDVTQPREHHWDVFNHLVETPGNIERIIEGQPSSGDFVIENTPRFENIREHFDEEVTDGHNRFTLVKLIGLLHDIAKPATKTIESSGRIRFLGHHIEGAEMTANILHRLRLSGRGIELARLMVHHHLRPGQMAQNGELPSGKAIYRYYRDVGDAAIDTLYLNMGDFLAARGPQLERQEWTDYCRVIGHILSEGSQQKAPDALPKIIDGHDIIKEFSISPGPEVGELLNIVHEAQANGEISTKKDALKLVEANLKSGGGRA